MMKNFKFILIILILVSSCSNIEEKKHLQEFFSNDYKKIQSENEIEIVDLDSFKNFSELRNKMAKLTCVGKVSGLRFMFNKKRYHITGFSNCPSSGEIGCYFRRNYLSIRNDSLILGYGKDKKEKPINYLNTELQNIMAKPHNFRSNENKIKPALFHFYVEDKYPISTTKRVLKEIAEQFSAINSKYGSEYFKYSIHFESFDITNIPPPPPPPEPNEFDVKK